MIEKLAKFAERNAERSAESKCVMLVLLHQPKMPRSLVKKDEE